MTYCKCMYGKRAEQWNLLILTYFLLFKKLSNLWTENVIVAFHSNWFDSIIIFLLWLLKFQQKFFLMFLLLFTQEVLPCCDQNLKKILCLSLLFVKSISYKHSKTFLIFMFIHISCNLNVSSKCQNFKIPGFFALLFSSNLAI